MAVDEMKLMTTPSRSPDETNDAATATVTNRRASGRF